MFAAAAAAAATTPATPFPLQPPPLLPPTENRPPPPSPNLRQFPPVPSDPPPPLLNPCHSPPPPLPPSPLSSSSSSLVLHPSSFTHPSLFPTLSLSLLAQPFSLQRVNSSGPPPNRAALKPVFRTRHSMRCTRRSASRRAPVPRKQRGRFCLVCRNPPLLGLCPVFVPPPACLRTYPAPAIGTHNSPARTRILSCTCHISPSLLVSVSFHAPASSPSSLPSLPPFNPVSPAPSIYPPSPPRRLTRSSSDSSRYFLGIHCVPSGWLAPCWPPTRNVAVSRGCARSSPSLARTLVERSLATPSLVVTGNLLRRRMLHRRVFF